MFPLSFYILSIMLTQQSMIFFLLILSTLFLCKNTYSIFQAHVPSSALIHSSSLCYTVLGKIQGTNTCPIYTPSCSLLFMEDSLFHTSGPECNLVLNNNEHGMPFTEDTSF